jgi:hypothetical protein
MGRRLAKSLVNGDTHKPNEIEFAHPRKGHVRYSPSALIGWTTGLVRCSYTSEVCRWAISLLLPSRSSTNVRNCAVSATATCSR